MLLTVANMNIPSDTVGEFVYSDVTTIQVNNDFSLDMLHLLIFFILMSEYVLVYKFCQE